MMKHIGILVLTNTVISLLVLKFAGLPYIWLGMLWGGTCLYIAIVAARSAGRLTLVYLGVILLTLTLYESVLWWKAERQKAVPPVYEEFSPPTFTEPHEILGYAPQKNINVTHLRKHGAEVDFEAVYTINADGLRITPAPGPDCERSIWCFGGSFTFGEGVADQETLPYQLSLQTQERCAVYNFGYRGYGPHQMLAALEHELVEAVVRVPPQYVIYQAFDGHISRAAGFASWDSHGPRYVFDTNGRLVYTGAFHDHKPDAPHGPLPLKARLKYQLLKSLTIAKLSKQFAYHFQIYSQDNIQLFAAIVDRSRQIIQSRYPACRFYVLFWESDDRVSSKIVQALRKKNLPILRVSEILPDYETKSHSAYSVSPYDAHPGPLAYKLIAEYLAQQIIR